MDPTVLGPVAFTGVLALFLAAFLLWNARRLRASDVLRRRLGERKTKQDELMQDEATGLGRWLAESGLGWTASDLVTRIGVAALLGLVGGIALGSGAMSVVLALLACSAMWFIVRRARARRLAQCDEQMPQALEIMALALRAGHALPGALDLAAQEAPAPLCHELRFAHEQQQLGRPITEVLKAMGERLPGCTAVETFVVAVAVLQETGGNLIQVIDRIVENARARSGYQTRLRALTAEGRQSARMLALMPVGFFVLAMASDPNYAGTLLYDGGGRMILLVAVALWLGGIAWTRRLVRPMT
ncbi:MAG: type II secretion system F family protein [Deltaproteobacteria bacterium]|nr:type II secretion system F family protein [Deltaproteobacteria bacterium]